MKKASIILIDWSVRESFHSVYCLNHQTVSRDQYEVIWVEYYGTLLEELVKYVKEGQLDKYIGLGEKGMFFKQRMCNEGVIRSESEIIIIPDSDAYYSPTFLEAILTTFEEHRGRNIVLYVDEQRKKEPLLSPPDEDAISWERICERRRRLRGQKPKYTFHWHPWGTGNYGACLCATKKAIIEAGGFDEHPGYLSLWGGVELGWRLRNKGYKEIWHPTEWIIHYSHPGANSEIEIPWELYPDPHIATTANGASRRADGDARGYSKLTWEVKETGRTEPLLENEKIHALRMEGDSD